MGKGGELSQQGQVWLLEDSPAQAAHARRLLEPFYAVETFSDGESMLEALAQASPPPDTLLLDWQLPGTSGLEVCRFVRQMHGETHLPILMLTARGERTDFLEGLTAGANDYVAKPYDDAELLARVRTLVRIRQQAEALRVREEWFSTTLHSIGDAVIATDSTGCITFLNPVAVAVTGWTWEEVRNQPLTGIFHIINEYTRLPVENPVERVLREGHVVGLANHTLLIRKDGSEVPIDDSAAPIRDGKGALMGVVLVFRDISDKKLAETERALALSDARTAREFAERSLQETREANAALGASEERFALAFRATQDAIWDWNLVTNAVNWNPGISSLFGYSPQEVGPDATWWIEHIHPDDQQRVLHGLHAVIDSPHGQNWYAEYRYLRSDGTHAFVKNRGFVVRDTDHHAVRMVGAMQDATSQRRSLDALREREELFRGLLDATAEGIWGMDANGRCIFANPACLSLLGYSAVEEILGHDIHALTRHTRANGTPCTPETCGISIALSSGQHVGMDNEILCRKDGQRLHVRYQANPLRRDHQVVGAVVSFEDISARKAVEKERERLIREAQKLHQRTQALLVAETAARREAEKAREFEQHLAGIVSHDLRNPLSVILMSTQVMLRQDELEGRTLKAIARIQNNAELATRMVRDLLDFTQARLGGGLPIQPRPLNVHVLVRQVVEEACMSLPEREIRITADGNGEGAWDPDRITQLMTNLVTNALKYSPADTPVLVKTLGEQDAVTLEVHNKGTPIPEEAQALLFQPMQRATSQWDKQGRSVGLGLYIVENIARAHGGSVAMESTAEGGTTFRVRLPRVLPRSPPGPT
ncbi:PAS domain S-box protein [Stigmatella sp. ncwal1]|uniref:histidine kinase n=1 Tax=Stigmatella ashevillensis TaxID=2995309 RepID=A0ABT5DKY1_9BACT|nr:PAS domain S-box protein [Stigmatella ashevillena]MDC0713679.1 PAS domain S-box protein [Stigmatella ashevillena]